MASVTTVARPPLDASPDVRLPTRRLSSAVQQQPRIAAVLQRGASRQHVDPSAAPSVSASSVRMPTRSSDDTSASSPYLASSRAGSSTETPVSAPSRSFSRWDRSLEASHRHGSSRCSLELAAAAAMRSSTAVDEFAARMASGAASSSSDLHHRGTAVSIAMAELSPLSKRSPSPDDNDNDDMSPMARGGMVACKCTPKVNRQPSSSGLICGTMTPPPPPLVSCHHGGDHHHHHHDRSSDCDRSHNVADGDDDEVSAVFQSATPPPSESKVRGVAGRTDRFVDPFAPSLAKESAPAIVPFPSPQVSTLTSPPPRASSQLSAVLRRALVQRQKVSASVSFASTQSRDSTSMSQERLEQLERARLELEEKRLAHRWINKENDVHIASLDDDRRRLVEQREQLEHKALQRRYDELQQRRRQAL